MNKYSKQDIVDILKSRIGKERGKTSMKQLAVELGVNYTVLSDVIYGRKAPTEAILNGLNFEKIKKIEVYYVKKKEQSK